MSSILAAVVVLAGAARITAQDLADPERTALGFAGGLPGTLPRPWFVPRVFRNWQAEIIADGSPAGGPALRLAPGADATPSCNVMQTLPVGDLAGRRVRLTAQVRVAGKGQAQMWLRVDRQGGEPGGFDNMADRPLTADAWQGAVIELDVAADARTLALGFLAFAGSTVTVADVVLTAVGSAAAIQPPSAAGALSERELRNAVAASRLFGYLRFFHPSDALTGIEGDRWGRLAVALLDAALPAADDDDLVARIGGFVGELAPTVQLWVGGVADQPPAPAVPEGATHRLHWRHHGAGSIATAPQSVYRSRVIKRRIEVPAAAEQRAMASHVVELADGVQARLPLSVWSDGRRTLPASRLPAGLDERARTVPSAANRTTRLAAVAEAWTVFQHFYPYFDVVRVDWDAALAGSLAAAALARDGREQLVVLERLVAVLGDGHGHVSGPPRSPDSFLPVAVRWAGEDLVVTGGGDPAAGQVRIGDVVTAIDGQPVSRVFAAIRERISAATAGWARWRSQPMFASWPSSDPVTLQLRRLDGTLGEVSLPRASSMAREADEHRPANGSEVAAGIVYFDLVGADEDRLDAHLAALERAEGIVFDMRGYPNSAAMKVLTLLITQPGQSARWGIPVVTWPDRRDWQWMESGRWLLRPRQPHLGAEIAFLTDGRAISYAESIMGVVEAYRLGEIVGAATAGTNGNVNPFEVVGGFRISWTGMRVLKHDGSRHHGVGIAPTVSVTPTPAGIAAGRDEVLDRAIEVLQQKLRR